MPGTNEIALEVRVSAPEGIQAYGFAYGGKPVIMHGGEGQFVAVSGKSRLLEWGMVGEPGGHMTVEVLRDGAVIKKREKSEIVPPMTKGYDAFAIVLA